MIITLIVSAFIHKVNLIISIIMVIILSFWFFHFKKPLNTLKAFINVARSPVYNHLNSTITGLIAIRTY